MIETKFKQTELGPIPEDWNIYTLGTVSDIKTGPFGSALHASDYVRFGTPIITVEHLGEPYIIHAPNIPLVGLEDKKRLSQYTLRTGDIVYSRVGSVDRNSVVTENEDGWLFSGRLLRVRNSDTYYAPYLGYHLNSNNAKKRIISSAVGLGMPSINTKILGEHIIILPSSIDEQKRIAEALSDIDDLTHELDSLIEKKKAVLQGTMQELLTGNLRLPGFNESWKSLQLKDCGYFIGGGTPSTNNPLFWNGEIPWISSSDLAKSRLHSLTITKKITDEAINFSSTKRCPKDTILIVSRVGVGKADIAPCEVCTSQDFTNLVLYDGYDVSFIAYYLIPCLAAKSFEAQGTSIQGISTKEVKDLQLIIPTNIEEQKAIAAILSDMDAEIGELEAKREKYTSIRQGMMQQLLTGKIRLI